MRLDQELVRRGLCESRTEAQELIEKGVVFVAGVVCKKQTKQVDEKVDIKVTSSRQFVSRGGEKLQGVLRDVFGDDKKIQSLCTDKKVLDVGASTGGFSDYLLSYGVKSIDAVDVGENQLHQKIKNDTRITSYEKTDIRNFKTKTKYDIIVADLSFISLSSIFDNLLSYGTKGTHYFLLIKPQFEVGKGNTKKGIVKDISLIKDVIKKYENVSNNMGLRDIAVYPSVIKGGDGNQEYFLHFTLP